MIKIGFIDMNEISAIGMPLQRLRTKRLIKSMQLFKIQQKGDQRYPIRAGYVAKRLANTQKQFNKNLLETYPNNLLHFVSEDLITIKPEKQSGQDPMTSLFSVNSEDAKNIPAITAVKKRFDKFLGILKKTYIENL